MTTRTIQSRFLLRPSPGVNCILKGVLGRAQKRYTVEVVIAVAMSSHIHALIVPESSKALSQFMRYMNSNIARKIGRLYGWREKFWARRYQAITVSDEEPAQVARLRYILRHGAKEGLVSKPSDWPGLQFVDELCRGFDTVQGGVWHDQSAEYNAGRRGERTKSDLFKEKVAIVLSKLPCWQHLSWSRYAAMIRDQVQLIEEETRRHHEHAGTAPLGVKAVLRQDPHSGPKETKRSPAPSFHAWSRDKRAELVEAYNQFVLAFRSAAEQLKRGVRDVAFPEGAFPPGLPWVPEIRPSPA